MERRNNLLRLATDKLAEITGLEREQWINQINASKKSIDFT